MRAPDWQRGGVRLYLGDARDLAGQVLADEEVGLLVWDPPYYRIKGEHWDRQWSRPAAFLEWLGECLDAFTPGTAPWCSFYVYAWATMASRVEVNVLESRLRLLNRIEWDKGPVGWSSKAKLEDLRRWFPTRETVLFSERLDADDVFKYARQEDAARRGESIREHLVRMRDAAGLKNRQVDQALGLNGMAGHWFGVSQWEMPTAERYRQLVELFAEHTDEEPRGYEDLKAEHGRLVETFRELRRPFSAPERGLHTDTWRDRPVPASDGKHPCEKPMTQALRIVETSSRPGETVLDPMMGRGSFVAAAVRTGRRAIGFERSERWLEAAVERLEREISIAESTPYDPPSRTSRRVRGPLFDEVGQ